MLLIHDVHDSLIALVVPLTQLSTDYRATEVSQQNPWSTDSWKQTDMSNFNMQPVQEGAAKGQIWLLSCRYSFNSCILYILFSLFKEI